MMQMRRYVVGERDGGGGGGGIYRSVGITWAAGNGFKIQVYPCLSLGNGFQAEPIARVGSPESCLKPFSAALVIPAPQPASVSPAPIPFTDGFPLPLLHPLNPLLIPNPQIPCFASFCENQGAAADVAAFCQGALHGLIVRMGVNADIADA